MLTASELAILRKHFYNTLPINVEVKRQVSIANNAGGERNQIQTVVHGRGRVVALSEPRVAVDAGRPVVVADYELYLASELASEGVSPDVLDVKSGDVVFAHEAMYTVVSTNRGESDAVCVIALCRRMQ